MGDTLGMEEEEDDAKRFDYEQERGFNIDFMEEE